jgi:hypothetical protein
MTAAEQQIEKLEIRVDRLEESYKSDIVAIHSKLDGLTTLLNQSLVSNAKHACPSPGACIILGEKLDSQSKLLNANVLRVERLELRMMDIEKWQGKLTASITVIVTIITIFGPSLRKLFKLE